MGEAAVRKMRPVSKAILWLIGVTAVISMFASRPAGDSRADRQQVNGPQQATAEHARPRQEEASANAAQEARLASGEQCLSGWDGSFPRLKDAVRMSLRNPRSFEHVSTVRSPVDGMGKFGLIMTYRAENGFGGMNVEAAGVEVDVRTCEWRQVSVSSLARRLRS